LDAVKGGGPSFRDRMRLSRESYLVNQSRKTIRNDKNEFTILEGGEFEDREGVYTPDQIKKLIQCKKNSKKYKKVEERVLSELSEVIIPTGASYKSIEKAISTIYMSGDKLDYQKNLRRAHFERYYLKKGRTHLHGPEISTTPWLIRDTNIGQYAIPYMYTDTHHSNESIWNVVEFDLPPQFSFFEGLNDWENLMRSSGSVPGKPYKNTCLRFETKARGTWSRQETELSALTYFYDMFPYAYIFGGEKVLEAIIRGNSGDRKMEKIIKTEPLRIDPPQLEIDSQHIPFELEGELIVLTVERLIEVLTFYRNPEKEYPWGGCSSHARFLTHLIYSEIGKHRDMDIVEFIKSSSIEELTREVLTVEPTKPTGQGLADEEIYYYYASDSQRELIEKKLYLTKERKAYIDSCRMFGMREMFLDNLLSGIDHEVANAMHFEELQKDKEILERMSLTYGTVVEKKTILDFDKDLGELEDDPFGGLFADDEMELEPIVENLNRAIDSNEEIFQTEFSVWNNYGKDPIEPVKRIWDPGGSTNSLVPGKKRLPGVRLGDLEDDSS